MNVNAPGQPNECVEGKSKIKQSNEKQNKNNACWNNFKTTRGWPPYTLAGESHFHDGPLGTMKEFQ